MAIVIPIVKVVNNYAIGLTKDERIITEHNMRLEESDIDWLVENCIDMENITTRFPSGMALVSFDDQKMDKIILTIWVDENWKPLKDGNSLYTLGDTLNKQKIKEFIIKKFTVP